jgi:hypothetical protein
MFLKGKDVILKMGGVAIAAAKSCEVNVEAKTIDTASPTDGAWESSIPGRKAWTASCSHLVVAIADSVDMVGQVVTLTFQPMSDVQFADTVNNPTIDSGTPSTTGKLVFDTVRKDFLWRYSPAAGVQIFFQNFAWKPALLVGGFYYNQATAKTYQWDGTTMNVVQALTGTAIVRQWKGTFTLGNLAQGSYSFKGSGPLVVPTT